MVKKVRCAGFTKEVDYSTSFFYLIMSMIAKWFSKNHLKSQAALACIRCEGNIKNIMLTRRAECGGK